MRSQHSAQEEKLKQAAECLRALAHPQRLRILQLLSERKHSVGELAEACGTASHVCSEHLRLMERCNFLSSERLGKFVYYQIVEPRVKKILECIQQS